MLRSRKQQERGEKNGHFSEIKDLRDQIQDTIETKEENKKIYQEVIAERKKFLMSSYLMRGQDDLEKILETLYEHFKHIKLTSFENLARTNPENKTAKDLIDMSNNELINLEKTLGLLQLDDEDVRFDIFNQITEMLRDNIGLRVKQNKLSLRLLA
jgi:hypothetical protein